MKKRKCIAIFVIVLVIILSLINLINSANNKEVTLTQLSPQSSRQMMSYLIKTQNNKLIIVDGGTIQDADNLKKNIYKNGGKVDYWFLTHAHDDHVGAFTEIINKTDIPVEKIYATVNELNWYEKNEPSRVEFTKKFFETLKNEKVENRIIEPKINQTIKIDKKINAEILKTRNPEITQNAGNEQSMVIKFNIGNTSFLVLGDLGENGSRILLNTQREKLKSDIVQMSHHGQAGATRELYEEVRPKICLWPTPEWLWNNNAGEGFNTGPWKTLETRDWIKNLKVEQNFIAKDGDISINIKE